VESGRCWKKAAQDLLLNWASGDETNGPSNKGFASFCSQKEARLVKRLLWALKAP
jgi:hypothetical protein